MPAPDHPPHRSKPHACAAAGGVARLEKDHVGGIEGPLDSRQHRGRARAARICCTEIMRAKYASAGEIERMRRDLHVLA
jgi:hypothetical protein